MQQRLKMASTSCGGYPPRHVSPCTRSSTREISLTGAMIEHFGQTTTGVCAGEVIELSRTIVVDHLPMSLQPGTRPPHHSPCNDSDAAKLLGGIGLACRVRLRVTHARERLARLIGDNRTTTQQSLQAMQRARTAGYPTR